MKILHVFSDEKFIDRHIKVYGGSDFKNVFAILKENHSYKGKYIDEMLHLYPGNAAYKQIREERFSYNVIVVYFLDEYKIRLINDLKNPKTKILWSFYGAEIYSLPSLKYQFLSRDTQRLLGYIKFGVNTDRIKQRLKKMMFKIQGRSPFERQLKRVCKDIDYFLWYNKYEYDFLNAKLGFILPPFLQSVFSDNIGDIEPSRRRNSKTIMLGNSRSPYNNHINILKLLKKVGYVDNIVIPFGYGTNSKYVNRLKLAVRNNQFSAMLIEEYVSFKEYVDIVSECTAVIFNSYRQMALGNVLIAIRFGVKVYLNEWNPLFKWLVSMGFVIYSVQKDFEFDVSNDKLSLEASEILANEGLYYKLMDTGHNKDFIHKIKNI